MDQGLLVSCLDTDDLLDALQITADIGYRHCEISMCPDDGRPNLASLDHTATLTTTLRTCAGASIIRHGLCASCGWKITNDPAGTTMVNPSPS